LGLKGFVVVVVVVVVVIKNANAFMLIFL